MGSRRQTVAGATPRVLGLLAVPGAQGQLKAGATAASPRQDGSCLS